MKDNLGACPTNEHSATYPQCGFAGCIDLRPWANGNRYRYRLEESYKAENNAHVKGDGRWYVEIPCQYGLIYPYGGEVLLAYANRGVKRHISALPGTKHHQDDDGAEVFRFPVSQLDAVAAILKPRRKRTVTLTPEQIEVRQERLRAINERRKSTTSEAPRKNLSHVQAPE